MSTEPTGPAPTGHARPDRPADEAARLLAAPRLDSGFGAPPAALPEVWVRERPGLDAGAGGLRVVFVDRDDRASRTKGAAGEVRVAAEGTLHVGLGRGEAATLRGWAGAVDVHRGYRAAGAALARWCAAGTPGASGAAVAAGSANTEEPAGWGPGSVVLDAARLPGPALRHVVLGYLLAAHRQDALASAETRARRARPCPPLVVASAAGLAVGGAEAGRATAGVREAAATALAREVAGAPANLADPSALSAVYSAVLRERGLEVEVLGGERLLEERLGGVLAVGGGSARPPRVLVARRPGSGTRVLLVGKGVTFDSGGISVKPAENLHLMRTDMGGSAALVAGLTCASLDGALGELDVTLVVGLAENLLSGSAYRPGDVVTHRGGRTSEITNTDAEGRIVLADCLAYGIELADPDVVVDAATLTGAMKIALGMRTGAVLGNDDALAAQVSHAGAEAGERWWRLPLVDDLRPTIRSQVADLRQAPGGPGAITAAMFLEHFVDGRRWAHLDIAGPGRAEEELDEVAPVATGFGTRTVAALLSELAKSPVPAREPQG